MDHSPPQAASRAAALAALRERLVERGKVPPLPEGWEHQSAMLAAEGFEYGGDFIVADRSASEVLHMVLVDVCGSGADAVPTALGFAGALQSLIGAVAPDRLLADANAYLMKQPSEESFATAVQVEIELATGAYLIRSAGHPPALRWHDDGWQVDNAKGTALGAVADPEFHESRGVLAPGEALLFYTDGVVESRTTDIDTGIAWLQDTARAAVHEQWDGAARRVIDLVDPGHDDRAVLIVRRTGEITPPGR